MAARIHSEKKALMSARTCPTFSPLARWVRLLLDPPVSLHCFAVDTSCPKVKEDLKQRHLLFTPLQPGPQILLSRPLPVILRVGDLFFFQKTIQFALLTRLCAARMRLIPPSLTMVLFQLLQAFPLTLMLPLTLRLRLKKIQLYLDLTVSLAERQPKTMFLTLVTWSHAQTPLFQSEFQ